MNRDINDSDNDGCFLNITYTKSPYDYGYFLLGPILTTFISVGLIGNTLCLLVFCSCPSSSSSNSSSKRRIRHKLFSRRSHSNLPLINRYLIPLCIFDSLLLLGSFFLYNLPHLLFGRMLTYGKYVRTYPYAYTLTNTAHSGCIWLVVLLAAERFLAICHPFWHRACNTKRRSKLIISIVSLAALLFNAPRFFELEFFECFDWTTQKLVYIMDTAEFRNHQIYWAIYKLTGGLALFSLGPFVVLCFLSVRIWLRVKAASRLDIGDTISADDCSISPKHTSIQKSDRHRSSSSTSATNITTNETEVVEIIDRSELRRHIYNGGQLKKTSLVSNNNAAVADHLKIIDRSVLRRHTSNNIHSSHSPSKKVSISDVITTSAITDHQSTKSLPTTTVMDKQQRSLTITLLTVILKFLICHTLPAFLDIYETVVDHDSVRFGTILVEDLVDSSTLLIVINSSLNIFIYAFCNKSFRKQFKRLFFSILHSSSSSDMLALNTSSFGETCNNNHSADIKINIQTNQRKKSTEKTKLIQHQPSSPVERFSYVL